MKKLLFILITFVSFTVQAQIVHTDTTLTIDNVSYEEVDDLRLITEQQIVKNRTRRRYFVHVLPAGYTAVMQTYQSHDRRWIDRHNCGRNCFGSGPATNSERRNVELRYDRGGYQSYDSRAVMRNPAGRIVYIR